MLSENRIRVVEDIAHLSELVFLDLSHNLIEVLDTGSEEEDTECQLPESLISLNFTGNPFTEDEDYVEHIVTVSPYLKVETRTQQHRGESSKKSKRCTVSDSLVFPCLRV